MLSTPFLTQLDSRAAIKGTRDPLGVQAIWSRFGRHVVGNLTTVSNSVRDFTVLLLGYYFAERVSEAGGGGGDLATFLKWEQLAAYARARVSGERGFRGTDRVWTRLSEMDRVHLGTDSSCQILGNQKIYGLWGLYSVAAKASGLLSGDPARLTPPARELVERVHLPVLAEAGLREGRGIVERLRAQDSTLDLRERSKDTPLLEAVAKILLRLRARERDCYREHLLYGGPSDDSAGRGTRGVQRVFADLLGETVTNSDWRMTPGSIGALAVQARMHGDLGGELARLLERIRTCELLIAPAAAFFEFALACDGQKPGQIAAAVHEQWGHALRGTIDLAGTTQIESELRTSSDDGDSGARWLRLAQAFHAGAYEDALRLVLEQNAAIMTARAAAAPWAAVRDGRLVVRFRDEQLSPLPKGADLPEYWRHAYFIESLRSVAFALRS